MIRRSDLNVLGEPLQACCHDPLTGYLRNGLCLVPPGDLGIHAVCARMTEDFLAFTARRGNDLASPVPEYGFPGLRPGDHWCLCAARWQEAFEAGCAPPVSLGATHELALRICRLEDLRAHALPEV